MHLRTFPLSVFVLFVSVSLLLISSVGASPELWSQTYGGSDSDRAYSLIETSDGGYAIAGVSNSFGGFWLVKTDAFGNMLWSQAFGGSEYDRAESVIETSDGGYAIAGYTSSFGDGQGDFWLIKTDAYGNMEWNQTYGGKYDDWAYSVVQTSDGGYALAGRSAYLYPYVWFVKTDAYGIMEWNQTYGEGEARSLVVTSDGGYAIAGGPFEAFLAKTDAQGNMEWKRTYGGQADDRAYSLVEASDGGYALAGYTMSFGSGLEDFWLVKTDGSGNVEWSQTYGGASYEIAYSLVEASDGGYALAGRADSEEISDYGWLVKTDSFGSMEWNQTYDGSAYSLVETSDDCYAIAGEIQSSNSESIDFWLAKIDEHDIIPEFPSWILILIALTLLAVALIISKSKLIKNQSTAKNHLDKAGA